MKRLIPSALAFVVAAGAASASSLTMTVNKSLVGPGEEVQFILNGRPGELVVFLASPSLGPIPYPKVGSLDIGTPSYIELIVVPPNGTMICIPDNPCQAVGTLPLTMHTQAFSVDTFAVNQPVTGKTGVVSVTYDQSLLEDCNGNATADVCDIQSGFSFDVNTNGIPDECEIDCDQDGIPDGLFPVGGLVWHDVDGDGVPEAGEPGVPNVIVTILDGADQVVAGTMTGPDGRWKVLNVASPAGLRVEFTDLPPYLSEPPAANGAGTAAQYVFGPDCAVDLGLIEPSDLCPDPTAAELATPCYVNGDPTAGGTAGPLAALVRFNYQSTGLDTSANVYLADAQHVGALWGLAYARSTDVLYGATFLKRHSGFGPGGVDAIYEVKDARTAANPAANVSVWLNVNTLPGQNVGTVVRPDLPANFDQASYEVDAYAKVGKVGLGGIDLSDDDKSLFVVNLNSREVLEIDVATKTLVNTWSAVAGVGCSNGEARPFAVEWHRGELYVGVVCTAEGPSGFFTDLTMHVRRLVNGAFQDCLTAPLNYPKGFATNGCPVFGGWFPWVSFFPPGCAVSGPVGIPISFPEPVLADLEFAADGTLALGFIDRMSHNTGTGNFALSGTNLYEGFTGGDLLKAMLLEDGTCVLEQNGSLGGVTTAGAGNNQGPGGGEFYFDERFGTEIPFQIAHQETSLGGVARLPGTDETVATVFDPAKPTFAIDAASEVRTGGVRFFDDVTGDTNDLYKVYNINQAGTFGKSAGLGDLVVMCEPGPIEVGDAVFLDANANGVRDPGESGIANVTVTLWLGGAQVQSTTTGSEGEYLFSGLDPCTDHEIRIVLAQPALAGLAPTTANAGASDLADSDGVPSAFLGASVAPLTTGIAGENDFTVDFGFVTSS